MGRSVGAGVGFSVGAGEGCKVGGSVGAGVGFSMGTSDGAGVGSSEGAEAGTAVGVDGDGVGRGEGFWDGEATDDELHAGAEVEAEPGLLENMLLVLTPVRSQQRTWLKAEAYLNIPDVRVTLPTFHAERSPLNTEAK